MSAYAPVADTAQLPTANTLWDRFMRCLRSCWGLGSFRTALGLGGWTFRLLPLLLIAVLLAGSPGVVQAQSVAAPTGLAAKPGDAQVKLTWDDPSDDTITGYDYQQKKEGDAAFGSWTTIPQSAPTNANALSYTATGLTNGIEYTFRLRVRNPVGTSSESNEATTTPWPKPAKPEGFEVTPQNGQVRLTWDRSDDPSITGWQYWLRKGANIAVGWQDIDNCDTGTDGCVDDGDANTIAYLVTGLENGLTDDSGTSGGKITGTGSS